MVHKMGVTLEELYNGKKRKLAANRDLKCENCDGKGGMKVTSCAECKGRGMKTQMKQIGPGMIQQTQSPCSVCSAKGEVVEKGSTCKEGKGKGTTRDKKILEVKNYCYI